jgi:hypothetical protein
MEKKKIDIGILCCERFRKSYEQGEISYSYEQSDDADETEWYINYLWHLYYCPFCGAFIKGYGFGDYEKIHPPAKGTKRLTQGKVSSAPPHDLPE